MILNTTVNKAIDANKEKNTTVNKKLNTAADETINTNKKQDAIASKKLNTAAELPMLIKN